MNMPTPETCTILAALRLWQQGLRDHTLSADLRDIACNDGAGEVLTTKEIDQLCEELNFGDLSAPAYRDFHRTVSSILRDPNGEFKELQSCADAISEISEALENAEEIEKQAPSSTEKTAAELLANLIAGVRGLKLFSGPGGYEADHILSEALSAAEDFSEI